jgi:hypothetical protein
MSAKKPHDVIDLGGVNRSRCQRLQGGNPLWKADGA